MLSNLELYVAKAYQKVGDTEIEIAIIFSEKEISLQLFNTVCY